MKKLSVDARVDVLDDVLAFVDSVLEENDCPMKVSMQIDVAVEEVFVNIASYAYSDGTGKADISIEVEDDPKKIVIEFSDNGMPFDPLAKEDPDVTLSAEERQIGGLGIYMVKRSMDDVKYRYENGCNILTISKYM